MANNNTPRISVNKLGEYMISKGARQRQILRDQKFPLDFKGMYYREASEAVATCLASALEDLSSLSRTFKILSQLVPDKIGTQRRVSANMDAIEIFDSMLDAIDFKGGTPELGPHRPERMPIQNVEISVRPEIVIRGKARSGGNLLGAVKVHYSRTFPLDEDSAGYVSAVVQDYCKTYLASDDEVHAPYCFVIDIGSQKIYPGVRSITARLKDVTAECRNILALWPSIRPDE